MTVAPGRYGIFARGTDLSPELVGTIERLGYGAVWIGGSPPADLEHAESLLAATEHLVVATGIVNMWASPASEVATSYRRIAGRYPDRFLLGVGIGHPEATGQYRKPYATIVEYPDNDTIFEALHPAPRSPQRMRSRPRAGRSHVRPVARPRHRC